MKQDLMDQYLDDLKRELQGFLKSEKRDIAEEFKVQIQEKQKATNLPISVILNTFGSPQELARTYRVSGEGDSYLESPRNIMESYVYFGLGKN